MYDERFLLYIITIMNEYNEFILCYRKPHSLNWDCEKGYKTVMEVDDRTHILLNKDPNLTTTFFSTGNYTPMAFKQLIIQSALSPRITMYNKPSSNGERDEPIIPPNHLKQDNYNQISKPKVAYF